MKKISRSLLQIFLVLVLISCASTKSSPVKDKSPAYTDVVETKNGYVRGVMNSDKSVDIFAGIPFAKPPVGDLRWKEPQNVDPWDGVYEADHFAPMAMQSQDNVIFHTLFNMYTHAKNSRTYGAPMSEDCLYLNIWKPAGVSEGAKLPVLVYIHGGSLMSGQSWYEKIFAGKILLL